VVVAHAPIPFLGLFVILLVRVYRICLGLATALALYDGLVSRGGIDNGRSAVVPMGCPERLRRKSLGDSLTLTVQMANQTDERIITTSSTTLLSVIVL
jgi:hypothetical protein